MAENPGNAELHPSHWQCSNCGFKLSGVSVAVNFCPVCGSGSMTTVAPPRPHEQQRLPSLEATQNFSATHSQSAQHVFKATLQQSPEVSPQPDPHLHQDSPTGVSPGPHLLSSGHDVTLESSGQPSGWKGSGQLSAEKSNVNALRPNAQSSSNIAPRQTVSNGYNQNGGNAQKRKQSVLHIGAVQEERAYMKPDKAEDCTKGNMNVALGNGLTADYQKNQKKSPTERQQSQEKYDYKSHSKPRWDLKGLQAPFQKSITVTFHAIVPKFLWEWDDSSCMHIQFGHKDLGEWKHNLGVFMESGLQDDHDGHYEMTCALLIEAELLKKPLEYKYVIFSSKVTGTDDCYEFLYCFAGLWVRDFNRCLSIDKRAVVRGIYHQYDMIVYPRASKEYSIFGDMLYIEDVKEFEPPSRETLAAQCLQFYLKPYMKLLQDGEYPMEFKVDSTVTEIKHIYSLLSEPWVHNHKWSIPLAATMKEWLKGIVMKLRHAKSFQHQFISAVCVACCLQLCHINYRLKKKDFLFPLLGMFKVQLPTCPEYTCLCNLLVEQRFCKKVAAALEQLCEQAAKADSKETNTDWLFVLPLYHFTKGTSDPFMPPEYNPERIIFKTPLLDRLGGNWRLPQGCVSYLYKDLEPFFTADPLLLNVFIALCPKENYLILFREIPTYLPLSWMSHLAETVKSMNNKDAKEWVMWLNSINTHLKKETRNEPRQIVASVDAALLLFKRLTARLTKYNKSNLEVIKVSLITILLSLSTFNRSPDMNKDRSKVMVVLQKAGQSFMEWIVNKDVVGGSLFGGRIFDGYHMRELELWQSVLTLEVPSHSIAQQWKEVAKCLFEKRVGKVPARQRIDLVCSLEKNGNLHPILSAVLMEGGSEAINRLASNPSGNNVENLLSTNSEIVGNLFGKVLKRHYPQPQSLQVSLDDLLNWTYWPTFIKICKSEGSSNIKAGLPHDCLVACTCAISKLDEVFNELRTREVTILDLQKIEKEQTQMIELCEAAGIQQSEMNKSVLLSYKLIVEQRIEEFKCFKEQQGLLLDLCLKIHKIYGVHKAIAELQNDYGSYKINTLCTRSGNTVKVICFQSASSLKPFAQKFAVMTQECNSTIFNSTWSKTLEDICHLKLNLTISDVGPTVWEPVFMQCQQLLEYLHSGSMTLSNVDEHFCEYKGEQQQLERELKSLFHGVNKCRGVDGDSSWIHQAVTRIAGYWKLCTYCEAANCFLKLRDSLELTKGDFSVVERISKEVSSSMKDQTIADVDEQLLSDGHLLSEFTGHNLECIKIFCECQDIIQWIRQTTEDVSDLQNFVNVALATAAGGEDDFAHDRLSNLRTVGSRFGSLIYKLREDTGFVELLQCCTPLWTVLKNNPDLPVMLDSCNKALKWYKSVKETQGSVEVTSFGQMKNILCYGCYTVGGEQGKAGHSIYDIIHVRLDERDKQLPKKSYSLNELRDLESKLVLITGSKAENRAEMEQFVDTLHCVCRIAEVLIALQKVGNVTYIGWKMEFYCKQNFVEELQERAKKMEEELEKWKEEVRNARNKYQELNYYTTCQLLVLRSELGRIKVSAPYHKAQVMALLQSISLDITPDHVERVVAMKRRKITDREKRDEGASLASMESSTSSSYWSCTPTSPSENAFASVEAQSPHLEEDTSVKRGIAKLSVCDLDAKRLENFRNITEKFLYPEQFVLRAIKECGTGDWYEIMNWIQNSKAELEEMLQSMVSEDGEEDSEGEEEEDEEKEGEEEGVGEEGEEQSNIMEKSQTSEMIVKASSQGMVATHMQPDYKQIKNLSMFVDHDAEKKYLKLEELGLVLRQLNTTLPATVQATRTFNEKFLKIGHPNLLVVAPENVLRAALSLYMQDGDLPMPTLEEMLICNENTTSEEVNLLWQRAVCDEVRVFCLAHAEKLSYQVADKALRSLNETIQAKTGGYRLVIICSSQDEEKSHIISKLHLYRRPYVIPSQNIRYRQYLLQHFVAKGEFDCQTSASSLPEGASRVDCERSCVRVVSSTRAGMGKSLFIARMAEQLQKQKGQGTVIITIPIHGPYVTNDTVMDCLERHQDNSYCTILHFDIAPSVLWQVDTILFSLLIQKGLCDSQGRVWRNHPSQLYAIEVTVPETQDLILREKQSVPESCTMALLEMLPIVYCVTPKTVLFHMIRHTSPSENIVLMDDHEFESPIYQCVYQYLTRNTKSPNLDKFTYTGVIEGTKKSCLQLILQYCGVKDPSWAELQHFVLVLYQQLHSCQLSDFCRGAIKGFKSFVVKFMIRMSRDFATSSLRGEVAKENEETMFVQTNDDLEQYQIVDRKQWEQSSHPYIFFNEDGHCVTFVGFMVTGDGDLIDPIHRNVLERNIMTPRLHKGLKDQGIIFDEDHRHWTRSVMLHKLSTVMGIHVNEGMSYDPDETYVLTVDNLIKILAIQMRFRCGIPVVIMGETGCGKTRLIRFMCDLAAQGTGKRNMLIMKVHGGVTAKDIETFLEAAKDQAEDNRSKDLDTVVFFDEANTTDAMGLIKEVMCDRRLHGKPIPEDLKFIAACNPYRRHSETMSRKLRSAGLGFCVRETETLQKLGKIPLRELVYRVIEIPPSMRPLVYDFGQLNTDTEREYTHQMISDHIRKHNQLSEQDAAIIPAVTKVLAWSQKYMRDRKDECSFVSLRDVERAMIVFKYFFEKMAYFGPLMDKRQKQEKVSYSRLKTGVNSNTKALTRSLVLALSICYYARLSDREEYENGVVKEFTTPLVLPGCEKQFKNEIRWCQEVLLDSMELGKNIARNTALRENIFLMAICVDLRIPLFLVGKPGSSKSMAKVIVASSMQGQASSNDLLKSFKQVHMFSYQCSQLSTSESVIEVFNTAKRFQRNQDTTKYVPVVVLDEVGLAEDSPNLPLKALHPLLEDGTEGADGNEEILTREKRVAFIGISNWALDPAKMNRGVMVTRGDPDIDELVFSARGICSNEDSDPVRRNLEPYFQSLAEAYAHICRHQEQQFFGLRDFYSLIKMLYWMCEKTKMSLTGPQLLHAIKRNFGGLEDKNLDPVQEFLRRLPSTIGHSPDMNNVPQELHSFVNPDSTRRGLIKTSLRTKEKSWHGENRYLLFLTENYAALEILKQYLQDHDREVPPPPGSGEPSEDRDDSTLKPWEMEPFILFGSSFPKDKEYTQVCRNINQIKICMETGRTVILLNLENLYESLYDVLNQYYISHGGCRYVDLGLQTHKVKCRVHEEFKLILIAEKTTVYKKFPTPLINRLEKHFVLTSSVLEEWQFEVLSRLQEWVEMFSHVSSSNSRFKEKDAFVGYQKDTPAAVVFQASNQLRQCVREKYMCVAHTSYQWVEAWKKGLLRTASLDKLEGVEEDSEQWKQAVLAVSQFLLLQTTPPAALIRLHKSNLSDQFDRLKQLYSLQHHSSIEDFLSHYITHDSSRGGRLLQVTTHSHLLSCDEVQELGSALEMDEGDIVSFLLQEFNTELDFTNKVGPLLRREETQVRVLIIQCDFGHVDGDLIACARYRIYDMRAKALLDVSSRPQSHTTHVLFIIHLPDQAVQSSFVGFQGEPWVSCHIDELRKSSEGTLTLEIAQGTPISELFYGGSGEHWLLPSPSLEAGREVSESVMELKEMVPQHVARREETEGVEMEYEKRDGDKGRQGGTEKKMHIVDIEEEEQKENEEKEEEEGEEEVKKKEEEKVAGVSVTGKGREQDQVIQNCEDGGIEEGEGEIMGEGKEEEQGEGEGSIRTAGSKEDNEEVTRQVYMQCTRLNSCIQAAASRLQDSTQNKQRAIKRVELLIYHIPRKPSFPLNPNSFYGILVGHILGLLRKRESALCHTNWVLNEAMSRRSLQHGGTFKNVLTRKFDDVIVPIFAEIIAFLDHNCNLSLLQTGSETTPLCQFWLRMFQSLRGEQQLGYEQVVGRQKVPMAEEEFESQFPFSWLMKEVVDSQWDRAKSIAGNNKQQLHQQLVQLVQGTAVGETLSSGNEASCEEMYQHYLHDFVRIVHKCSHKGQEIVSKEYKLISNVMHNMIVHGPDFSSIDGAVTLTNRIAAVHIVYNSTCEELHLFDQLTFQYPGIVYILLDEMSQMSPGDKGMMIHIYAVEKVLDHLRPPIESNRRSTSLGDYDLLAQWLSLLQLSRNTIDSTLSLPSQHPLVTKARCKWHLIRVVQMFTEHVIMKHKDCDIVPFGRQLQVDLGKEPDFLKCETVNIVNQFLRIMCLTLKSKERKKLKRSCRNFFMEMISGLCFGQSSAPEDKLIEMLFNIVFTKGEEGSASRAGTRELTPYKEDLKKTDENPVIRSFLLQLLLEHNTEEVKGHLNDYFEMSCQALSSEAVDLDLCLFCTQCLEDALDKELSSQSLTNRLARSVDLLQEGMDSLVGSAGFAQRDISFDHLEGLAKVRYALLVVTDLLHQQFNEVGEAYSVSHTQSIHGATANQLLEKARQACTVESVNTIDLTSEKNTTGPVMYLLKMIVRRWGFGCLMKILEWHQWVMPVELRQDEQEAIDPFVMYNPIYSSLREVVNTAAYGQDFDGLARTTEAIRPLEYVPLLLAVYEVVTLSRRSTLPSRQLLLKVLVKFNELVVSCKALPKDLQLMALTLIANEQGGPLAALRVSSDQSAIEGTMTAIVVHTAAALFNRQGVDLLHPLVAMLTKPADLTAAYLPTMPEHVPRVNVTERGLFYKCPRGHPYLVGECTHCSLTKCITCGSSIGGNSHRPVADNRTTRINDGSQMGHCLGHPSGRSVIPSSERSLSPAACNILRAIMHSALIWASCNTDSATEGLLALVKPAVHPNELPEFFWGHLERDLQLVGRALGKSVEEAAIVVHLVIRHILTSDLTRSSITPVVKSLGTRNDREEWEKMFNHNWIQPVLEKVEDSLYDIILNQQDHGPLLHLMYEHVPVMPGSLEPHLWGYRPRTSLLHLSQALRQRKTNCPILRQFLKEEPILRATQYLPDIVRLQHKLYRAFHHRLDRRDARGKTISQFIKEKSSENVRNEYHQMVDSVQKAWSLVGDKLRDHARLRVDDEYLIPAIRMDTTLDYLVPTTTGPGACMFALVDYLVLVHNGFIEHCSNQVIDSSKSEWQEPRVPLSRIHRCHLLDYEHKLPSMVISHCHYSMQVGQCHNVAYDLPLLEKHILDQFILGKPTILVDIPHVVYCKEVYSAATFSAVRERVHKQVSLPSRVQQDILLELRSPNLLRRSLDVVDIVLGFLTSGGGKPKMRLAVYLKKLKMADKAFSEKAKEHCNLEHVLSLWQTLSVGLARMITLSGQEPFDTIPTDLMADLTQEQQYDLDQCLRRFDLDSLLVILYEFIEAHLRHIDVNSGEKLYGLVDTLMAYLENNNLEGLPKLEELPNGITLAETVAVWKYVVHFQEKQKQE